MIGMSITFLYCTECVKLCKPLRRHVVQPMRSQFCPGWDCRALCHTHRSTLSLSIWWTAWGTRPLVSLSPQRACGSQTQQLKKTKQNMYANQQLITLQTRLQISPCTWNSVSWGWCPGPWETRWGTSSGWCRNMFDCGGEGPVWTPGRAPCSPWVQPSGPGCRAAGGPCGTSECMYETCLRTCEHTVPKCFFRLRPAMSRRETGVADVTREFRVAYQWGFMVLVACSKCQMCRSEHQCFPKVFRIFTSDTSEHDPAAGLADTM